MRGLNQRGETARGAGERDGRAENLSQAEGRARGTGKRDGQEGRARGTGTGGTGQSEQKDGRKDHNKLLLDQRLALAEVEPALFSSQD